jgi:hypothetical protein
VVAAVELIKQTQMVVQVLVLVVFYIQVLH